MNHVVTKGQTLSNSNVNFLMMQCELCGQGFQGSQTKAAVHFTIKNNCPKVFMEQLAEIWNKTNYTFDQSHCRTILDFVKSRAYRENRCTSGRDQAGEDEDEDSEDELRAAEGQEDDDDNDMPTMGVRREEERARGKMRGEKVVDEDNTPDEDDNDHDADIVASLDGGFMVGGRRGQEGASRAMMEAKGSKKRKRKAKNIVTRTPPAPSLPKKRKILRQTSMVEAFNPVWQRDFSNYFLKWYYVSGIPFEAASRPEYHRMRKHLLECKPYTHPALPTHCVILGDDIREQQQVMTDLVAAIHKDIGATVATILTDGRKSITSDHIVKFLVAGPTGAYLFRTMQRDGAV
ncbi:hypothetical protein CBR_g52105 [Chara braunii]|uniref:Uncharacterized protein n=1 Tax=Chara braunii TaxID=69332 RepID=A0A388M9R2_CHABU|nr:hypothetical protein CBR_g52105 [Chara braunii]|eukprot:GBG91223.1 hypothetical protein CBR_g52105 [Chara braunii]